LEFLRSGLLQKREELVEALEACLISEIVQLEAKSLKKAVEHGESLLLRAEGLYELQTLLTKKISVIQIGLIRKGSERGALLMKLCLTLAVIASVAAAVDGKFLTTIIGVEFSALLESFHVASALAAVSFLSGMFFFQRSSALERLARETATDAEERISNLKKPLAKSETNPANAGKKRNEGLTTPFSLVDLNRARTLVRDSTEFKHIPAGSFLMGTASRAEYEAGMHSRIHEAWVNSMLIATTVVTLREWKLVSEWAKVQGYVFTNEGKGVSDKHPVTAVSWYDAVKWCNAKSEMEELVPCYKINGAVYRIGEEASVTCDWDAYGYRLPTEAEWEKAARGGLVGKKYPNGDLLGEKDAHFGACYGVGRPVEVGKYPANGYGLYDMVGNVAEWCWDWHDEDYSYHRRTLRGGGCYFCADFNRVTARRGDSHPDLQKDDFGFRLVRRSNALSS
jgi:formylglycine-generating enzyme required for sulfatase activity